MIDENMLITASKVARGITTAQNAVDEAKRLLEEARAGVEAAKTGLAEAKANYDAVIADIAGKGIPTSKAKKAVEDMLRIFAEVGIIDSSADDAPAELKPSRRKKSEPVPAGTEPHVQTTHVTEVVVESVTDADSASIVVAPEASEQLSDVAQEMPTAPEAHVASLVVETEEVAIDNSEAISEIYQIIEDATANEEIVVGATLITLLNAADWYSRDHLLTPLTLDLYREILSIDFVNQAVAFEGLDPDLKMALASIEQSSTTESAFEWFLHVLSTLENGKIHSSYEEFLAGDLGAPDAVLDDGEVLTKSPITIVEDDFESSGEADYIKDPEAEEEFAADISDDVTITADSGLVGVVVDDIEEINFLEVGATDGAATSAIEPTKPAPEAEKLATGGFKRPAFLSRINKKD